MIRHPQSSDCKFTHSVNNFLTKVGEKWLPNKEKVSYAIFFAMIKLELARTGLELAADMIFLDYELAIEQAASEAWPNIIIQGCH